jgi:hypothetical protein
MPEDQTRHEIDRQPVSRRDFEARLKTLKGKEGWYCKETSTGGAEGYRAQDSEGRWHDVQFEQHGTHHTSRITLRPL